MLADYGILFDRFMHISYHMALASGYEIADSMQLRSHHDVVVFNHQHKVVSLVCSCSAPERSRGKNRL